MLSLKRASWQVGLGTGQRNSSAALSSCRDREQSWGQLKTSKGVQGRRTGLLPLTSLGVGRLHNQQTHCSKFGQWKLHRARRQNTAESNWWWILFLFQAGWYFDLGGIWWDGSKDLLFSDCWSTAPSISSSSLTSNTCINFSLKQSV